MLFYILSALTIFASIMMILSHNPVRAVLSMVLAFVAMAGVWLLLEAEFLAIALILVYVGAVMVLFLFVVMMLDVESPAIKKSKSSWMSPLCLGGALFLLMVWLLAQALGYFDWWPEPSINNNLDNNLSNIQIIGRILYTQYVVPFEMAGIILLVAMIAAIGLAFKGRRSLIQNINQQVQASKSARLTIMKNMRQ